MFLDEEAYTSALQLAMAGLKFADGRRQERGEERENGTRNITASL